MTKGTEAMLKGVDLSVLNKPPPRLWFQRGVYEEGVEGGAAEVEEFFPVSDQTETGQPSGQGASQAKGQQGSRRTQQQGTVGLRTRLGTGSASQANGVHNHDEPDLVGPVLQGAWIDGCNWAGLDWGREGGVGEWGRWRWC
jgi:hypothetical protein